MGQAEHYDQILSDYERHYYDDASMDYRRRYIYPRMFDGLDLNGKRVVELACGSGHNSLELLHRFPGADLFGLDISPKSCESYRRTTGRPCLVVDLSERGAALPPPCDAAIVVGGLHHCVNDLPAAFDNLSRLLLPGGVLVMVEPNARFFLNRAREAWYKRDSWFREAEEAPLDHSQIRSIAREDFEPIEVHFLGGVAYFLILNSLIVRLPLAWKRILARPLFSLDNMYNWLPGCAPFPMFIARWRRVG